MKDLAPAAPAYSGGKLVIYEGDYTHITLTDALYMVLAVLVAILGILVIQHVSRLADRVSNLEFQVAWLIPEERPAVVAAVENNDAVDDPPVPTPAPVSTPAPAQAPAPVSRKKVSPAKPRPLPAGRGRGGPRARPVIDMNDPHAVRAALRAVLGVQYTLPAKRPELVQLFEATFPAAP